MHNRKPSYVSRSNWDSKKKKDSRDITIIGLFREAFGKQRLPPNKQYWTMCGAHFNDKDGKLDGEFTHMFDSGLIQPNQFHGVDREEEIILMNSKFYPHIKWIHGDFLETMQNYAQRQNFNPAVINYDGVMQPKYGTQYLRDILKFIDYNVPGELLLTANFILTNPYNHSEKLRYTVGDTIKKLLEIYGLPKHWIIVPKAYRYRGASINNICIMGIIMFVKKGHNVDNIRWT